MPDPEKRDWVIKGLEEVKHLIKFENLPAHSLKALLIMDDALALLKAREPRVLTLEEVIERKDSDAVWVEHMDGKMIVQPAVLLPSFLDTDKDCIHFASSWRTGGSYSRRSYGTKWRCWTSRPTDEQREATPW